MPNSTAESVTFGRKLNWLMSLRFLFALLLLGSTIAYQIANNLYSLEKPIVLLYGLSGLLVLLSAFYGLIAPFVRPYLFFFIISAINSNFFSLIPILQSI